MPDIRLVQGGSIPDQEVTIGFAQMIGGTLDETMALATAVVMALGTDARAGETDVLPDPDSTDRRGWWGDLDAEEIWEGWPVGCRLWLLRRAKITPAGAQEGATVARAEAYLRECLLPLVDRRIASSIAVTCERTGIETISAAVTIYRGPEPAIELRYADLWNELGIS